MSRQTATRDGQTIIITSDGRVRDLISWNDLTPAWQHNNDYVAPEDRDSPRFIRAYGTVIDTSEVPRCIGVIADFGWHGSESWSLWNGVTVRMVDDDRGIGAVVGKYRILGM